MEDVDILQPGDNIRPIISHEEINQLVSDLYGFKVLNIIELNGYDDKNYHILIENSEKTNLIIDNFCNEGYVLKIINLLDSKKPEFFAAQSALLLHLGKKGICCPKPILTRKGTYFTKTKLISGEHVVRLLEFINGSILQKVPCSPNLFLQVGEYIAKLEQALQDFHHSAYDTYKSLWMLQSVPELRQFIFAVTDENRRKIVLEVIKEFETRVLPLTHVLERGLIHGDFNEQNIIVDKKDDEWEIKAVIDFGDSHIACYVFDLAVSMTYMILQSKEIDAGGYVLAGYSLVREVQDIEFKLLRVCIAARLCQSLVLGAYSNLKDPENSYVLTTAAHGWTLLEEIWKTPEVEILQRWRTISRSE